jgi:hypothetical protein
MVPSVAFALAPKVMVQELAPVDESVHRPARLTDGATAAALLAGAPPGGGLFELLSSEKRSLPLQAASSAAQSRIGMVAMRDAMNARTDRKGGNAPVYQNVFGVSGHTYHGFGEPTSAVEATTSQPGPC